MVSLISWAHPDMRANLYPSGSVLDAVWLDTKTLISCGIDRQVHVCRLGEQVPIRSFAGHEDEINLLRLSKDRSMLASCSDDRSVRIWDLAAWQATGPDTPTKYPVDQVDPVQKCVLRGHVREVCSIGWCPTADGGPQHLLVTCVVPLYRARCS